MKEWGAVEVLVSGDGRTLFIEGDRAFTIPWANYRFIKIGPNQVAIERQKDEAS